MKKIITLGLSVVCAFTAIGCAPGSNGGGTGKETKITFLNQAGGIGEQWLAEAVERYEKLNENTSFGDGKVGVDVDYESQNSTESYLIGTDGHNIVVLERKHLYDYIASGSIYDMSAVYTTENKYDNGAMLKDKISAQTATNVQDMNGKWYGLPHYEYLSGLSYNHTLFEDRNLFIALDGDNGTLYTGNYASSDENEAVYFVDDSTSTKSYGPDGKTGVINGIDYSLDDGLPATLIEFIALCDVMKENDIEPITLAGQYDNYSNNIVAGFWAALAGAEQMYSLFNVSGKVEYVTETMIMGELDFTTNDLFPGLGIDYVKQPLTAWADVNEQNGYYSHRMAAEYYATAMLEIIYREGFLSDDTVNGSTTHVSAQENFIFGGTQGKKERGMLAESTYWWNETVLSGNGTFYEDLIGDFDELDIRFMPLPTSVSKTARANSQRTDWENTFIDTGYSTIVMNANVANLSQDVQNACVDFLQFLMSDSELKAFTLSTGLARPWTYDMTVNDLQGAGQHNYYTNLWNLRQNSNIVFKNGNSKISMLKGSSCMVNVFGSTFGITMGTKTYTNYLSIIKDSASTHADALFKANANSVSGSVWSGWLSELEIF